MKIKPFPAYNWDNQLLDTMSKEKTLIKIEPVHSSFVVLGRVTPHEPDILIEHCIRDNVPILRRKGGGGAVLLFPGVAIITAAFRKERKEELVEIEAFLNGVVGKIREGILKTMDIPLQVKGMGDLCIEDKKILGSSVYSTKDFISYYGSLIVSGDTTLMSRYLGHPSKEPDYRKGRSHEAFVTSIAEYENVENEPMFYQAIEESLASFDLNTVAYK